MTTRLLVVTLSTALQSKHDSEFLATYANCIAPTPVVPDCLKDPLPTHPAGRVPNLKLEAASAQEESAKAAAMNESESMSMQGAEFFVATRDYVGRLLRESRGICNGNSTAGERGPNPVEVQSRINK